MTREFYIKEILRIRDELFTLGVTPEKFYPGKLSDDELAAEHEAFSDQLATRKKFLERAGNGKNLIKGAKTNKI